MKEGEEEAASPSTRLMQAKKFNICIITVMGFNTSININIYKACVHQTLLNHPRISTILITDNGKTRWKRTTVDLEKHIFEVELDPNMEAPDEFVEDYASKLSRIPMDPRKPLWEMHILNVKTSDANSTILMKIHHSIGDGVSLMSLLHACSRQISNPNSLPSFPTTSKLRNSCDGGGLIMIRFWASVWTLLKVCFYTFIDCTLLVATILFLKDRETPLSPARDGAELTRTTRFVHRIVSLDDVRFVKAGMNMTINDVLLGATEAGLSSYLNTRYEKLRKNGAKIMKNGTNSFLPRSLSIRSAVMFNLRPSPTIEDLAEMMEKEELNGMWGNMIGIVLLPFTIDMEEDPLTYIRRAKSTMDRKKLSLAHYFSFFLTKLVILLFGIKAAVSGTRAILGSTTLCFSNVMGPKEEVNLFGHHLSYIAPSVHGLPQSVVVHYQSYGNKLVISMGADEEVVPNPHQLCDDLVNSFQTIKQAVIKSELIDLS